MEVHIKMSEVKFLDYFKMNISEGILKCVPVNQERKLGDRRRSDTVVVSTVNYADYELEIVLRGCKGKPFASDDSSSALQEIKSFWVPGGV